VAYDLLFLALAHAGKGDLKAARDYYARARDWYNTLGQGMTTAWRDEFSRLSDETRAAIMP
jgi:hypothetical protein